MTALVEIGLSNVLVSAALALVAITVGLVCRRPAVTHALWLLVLLKLVTPPLFRVSLPWPGPTSKSETTVVAEQDAPGTDTAAPGEEGLVVVEGEGEHPFPPEGEEP